MVVKEACMSQLLWHTFLCMTIPKISIKLMGYSGTLLYLKYM